MQKGCKKVCGVIALCVLLTMSVTACRNNTNAQQRNQGVGTETGNQTVGTEAGNQQARTATGNQAGNQQAGTATGNQAGNQQAGTATGNQTKNRIGTTIMPTGTVSGNAGNTNAFGDLLAGTDNIEEVYNYIEKNVKGATKEDWNTWMKGIASLGEDNVDYKRFWEYRNSMSEEMKSFVELMAAEQERPSMNETGTQLTLAEILERCIAMEEHIHTYRNGDTYSILYPKYCQLMSAAITGGYDGIDVATNEYLDKNKQSIRSDVIKEYERVIKEHPNSETADILEEYLDELKENGNVVNKEVEKFYENIYEEINDEFS